MVWCSFETMAMKANSICGLVLFYIFLLIYVIAIIWRYMLAIIPEVTQFYGFPYYCHFSFPVKYYIATL